MTYQQAQYRHWGDEKARERRKRGTDLRRPFNLGNDGPASRLRVGRCRNLSIISILPLRGYPLRRGIWRATGSGGEAGCRARGGRARQALHGAQGVREGVTATTIGGIELYPFILILLSDYPQIDRARGLRGRRWGGGTTRCFFSQSFSCVAVVLKLCRSTSTTQGSLQYPPCVCTRGAGYEALALCKVEYV